MSVRSFLASRWVRYGMVLIVAVVDIVLSVAHGNPTGPTLTCEQALICIDSGPFGVIGFDKWLHGIGYALLTATLIYAFEGSARISRRNQLALAVCLAVVFGICLEFVQWPIPQRTMSGLDAIADATGACLLAAVWWGMRTVQSGDSEGVSG
jgi:VanZ family protein